ncbi:RAMP superfamily CRISPR-associated protein [Marinomonas sp.]|uniref:RAMP superfamily CRISPR-associated protein n=1 Tax=Marinomonas sp. TaxID=1904862 RepID=UPI003BAA00A5
MHQQLTINITSYWHAGTGRTSGSHVDSLVEKDASGLPFLNGRHLKGLLRDAITRANEWGWFDDLPSLEHGQSSLPDWLFGTRPTNTDSDVETRFNTVPGIIAVSNAQLPSADGNLLANAPELRSELYRHIFSTAIDHHSGIAKEKSLRGIEVTIPLSLYAEVECNDSQAEQVFQYLSKAIHLIDHVGGMRNRGLGRAQISLSELSQSNQGGKA